MPEKGPSPYTPRIEKRANTLARLAAGIVLVPAGFAAMACQEINTQPGHSQEVPTPTQDLNSHEKTPTSDIDHLVNDYLQSIEKPVEDLQDVIHQYEIVGQFPVMTTAGQKTLDECLGNVGFTQEFELPSEDKLDLRVSLKTGEKFAWSFEKQAGKWESTQIPQCPIDQ